MSLFKSPVGKRTLLQCQINPVAKRTRLQCQLLYQGFNGASSTSCGSSNADQSRKVHEVVDVEDYWEKKRVSEEKTQSESGIASRLKERLNKSNKINESSIDVSEDEESDKEDSFSQSSEESNGIAEIDYDEFEKTIKKNESYSSGTSFKIRTPIKFDDPLDDSDSDDTVCVLEEQEEADKDLLAFFKHLEESGNSKFFQSAEDEDDEYFSESESDDLDDFDFSQKYRRPNRHTNKKHTKEKVWSGSVDSKEKKHSVQKTNIKKINRKSMDEWNDVDSHGKTDVQFRTVKEAAAKYKKSKKGRKVSRKNDGATIDAILNSIISSDVVHEKERDHDCIPLKFRFDDSEDESCSKISDESNEKGLFRDMDFAFKCEEIGSYRTPMVQNQEKDDCNNDTDLCQRGEHAGIYFEEQTGLRCRLCGAVLIESRYVISKLANYAPDRSRRSYYFDEQISSLENQYLKALDWNQPDMCKQTKGTVWELLPTTIRAHLYPHQQEGFEFLWENLAGTIDISRLHKLGTHGGGGGGGCIISHAPGTGKTLLTIVFIESFLKKFPSCCPVIVAPASMLNTWEAEFNKWKVGFSFLNLSNLDFTTNDMINGGFQPIKNLDLIRALKIRSWTNGNSVLGVSYNLYEKLAGNSNVKTVYLEKMGDVLLDRPNLVILDEGHTPRNQTSNIWNILLKLKTKNRVILSGTLFQNNFRELFNSLRLVRPAIASANEKFFTNMNQSKKIASEDIRKLKLIISPIVHICEGHILESKLHGLKQSVILLNPYSFQKSLIENLGNTAKTLEYDYKAALVCIHPSLILQCSLPKEEQKSIKKRELERVRLHPDYGVKTRFVMELIRLSVSLHEKVLIFSQFILPLELLKEQIAHFFGRDTGNEVTVIKGDIDQKARQTIINDFNDPNSKMKVLLASTKCCSEGIHLIGASRVVLLDIVWNPSVEKQAIGRAYRLGQKKLVYIYHLLAAGTTEEEKYERQVEKGRLAEMVFSSASMAGKELKKMNVVDVILEQMVNHRDLKDMFKEIK